MGDFLPFVYFMVAFRECLTYFNNLIIVSRGIFPIFATGYARMRKPFIIYTLIADLLTLYINKNEKNFTYSFRSTHGYGQCVGDND